MNNLTDRERYLVSQIRKALSVKGNPARTTAILVEAVANLPCPPKADIGTKSLDKAFNVEPERLRVPFAQWLAANVGSNPVGKIVYSTRQPGTVYSIVEEDEPVKGVRLFTLSVVKSKMKGGEGSVFHGVPETMLEIED